jgi:hypothetical protein
LAREVTIRLRNRYKEGQPLTVRVPLNAIAQEIVERYKNCDGDKLLLFTSEQKYNVAIKRLFALNSPYLCRYSLQAGQRNQPCRLTQQTQERQQGIRPIPKDCERTANTLQTNILERKICDYAKQTLCL